MAARQLQPSILQLLVMDLALSAAGWRYERSTAAAGTAAAVGAGSSMLWSGACLRGSRQHTNEAQRTADWGASLIPTMATAQVLTAASTTGQLLQVAPPLQE
jgi:hypothetical protein